MRLMFCFIVFCTGATQVFGNPGTLLYGEENEERPAAQSNADDSRPNSVLSDEEVLKLQTEKQDSIDRLEKTASEIARLWKEKQARKAAETSKSDPPKSKTGTADNKSSEQNSGIPTTVDSGENAAPNYSGKTDADPSESTGDSSPSPSKDGSSATPSLQGAADGSSSTQQADSPDLTQPKSESEPKSIAATPATTVVDGPIDRLSLATSLFATKELRECLRILEAVNLRPLSVEDRQWHDYLAASCYRDLGNRSEAESMYRSVLKRSSSTWLSAAARWWLDHIDERADLEQKLEVVQTKIENWRKEVDVLKSAN